MKQPKPKQAIIVMGLYIVSLILFFILSLIRSTPVLIFSLTYQPLNVTTTAIVDDEDFLILSDLNQVIEFPIFSQGMYRMDISTSGGVVVESLTETELPTLTLIADNQAFPIQINDLIGNHHVTWQQSTTSSVTLIMTNFVKINHSLLYGVYVQDIRMYKI
jgi:hypothetical protein